MQEQNFEFNAWVMIIAPTYTVRIPLSSWADSGPPPGDNTPELLGLARDSLEAHFAGSNCTGTPLTGSLALDADGKLIPGVRNVLIVPVASTLVAPSRTVRYYDASQIASGGPSTAGSRVFYDYGSGTFVCQNGFTFPQKFIGIGPLLFDSDSLPPEPYRIQ
jgi:hypothetical protein